LEEVLALAVVAKLPGPGGIRSEAATGGCAQNHDGLVWQEVVERQGEVRESHR
jgi:hypothetical protein